MHDRYRAVVIGGGIVGVSVLYHLAHKGWKDIALIERAELTAGSTWHAAAGFHAINDDPRLSSLQNYSIQMYERIQAESGQSVGLHRTGGLSIATSPDRWEWLKGEWALFQTLDMEARLVDADEITAMCPIVDPHGIAGGLWDPQEGHLDPHGATVAYAQAAKALGADVVLHNRVLSITPVADGWRLETERGPLVTEHVINAAGLWARRVGRMVGVDHPLVPMQHHYLVTEPVPQIAALTSEMPAVTDLEGFTYLRQEQDSVLLGVYERDPRHWQVEGAEWDYGMVLIPEEIDRISPELMIGLDRFPALHDVGIRRWVNGAITFTPDGNPLVGPVPGLPGYWAACGSMAGFSQSGAIGLALANWIVDGDPGADVFGMDVARFLPHAHAQQYLLQTTAQFYARRFVMAYPNEELPAGRPAKTTGAYDLLADQGAVFGQIGGMEVAQFFAPSGPGFVEVPTLRRPSGFDTVAEEVACVRERVGAFETAVYARYEVTGPDSSAWLDYLVSSRLPSVGRIRLAPMLNHHGRLMGDLSVSRIDDDRFWLVGSYGVQDWHMRWFVQNLPATGVQIENLSDRWVGFAVSGPNSRDVVSQLVATSVNSSDLQLLSVRRTSVVHAPAMLARLSFTGELGFEISVPAAHQRSLWLALREAGAPYGLRPYGLRALDSLRMEKGYGVWGAEFTPDFTAAMAGLDEFVSIDKGDFIGRPALLEGSQPAERLTLLAIDSTDADALGNEPVWLGETKVGYTTSGAYGHSVGMSLAFAYLKTQTLRDLQGDEGEDPSGDVLSVHIMGERSPARILHRAPYDPDGLRMRG